jgi:hypothetical protein
MSVIIAVVHTRQKSTMINHYSYVYEGKNKRTPYPSAISQDVPTTPVVNCISVRFNTPCEEIEIGLLPARKIKLNSLVYRLSPDGLSVNDFTKTALELVGSGGFDLAQATQNGSLIENSIPYGSNLLSLERTSGNGAAE